MYKPNQLAPTLARGKWGFDQSVGTIITEFQSGHGFTTSGADVSSNINDTTANLAVNGFQCATVVTAGAGADAKLFKTGFTAIDTTNLQAAVLLKVDDTTHLSSLYLSIANDSGFNNEYHFPGISNAGAITSGQWVYITIALGDAQTQGSPTRSGITAIRINVKDDNTGNKVTVHYNGIYFMPNAATQPGSPYPKGVCSITFDDSFMTQWTVAKPLLDTYGYRPTLFPIKDTLGLGARLILPQIKSMQDQSGWEVSAHTYTGANHATSDTGLTAEQLLWDKSSLKQWLLANGLDGQGYAYPKGNLNQSVIESIRKWFRYARTTSNMTETYPAGDPYRLKSFSAISTYSGGVSPTSISQTGGVVDAAVTNASWLILTFHNIIPTITSVTVSGTTATMTFVSNQPFFSGQSVTMAGFTPSALNGTYTVTCGAQGTTNTLTYTVAAGTGNATVIGTALGGTTDCDYASYQAIIAKIAASGIAVLPIAEVLAGSGIPGSAGTSLGSTVPSVASSTAAAAGTATTAAHSDHIHPSAGFLPADHGLKGWSYDGVAAVNSTTISAGIMYLTKIPIGVATTITNVCLYVAGSGGTGLTNSYVCLYDSTGTLISGSQSADVSTTFQSSANKTIPLGTPKAVSAGYIWVGFWVGAGTTLPSIARASGSNPINFGLTNATARFGSSSTGLTSTPPANLTGMSTNNNAWWVGVS